MSMTPVEHLRGFLPWQDGKWRTLATESGKALMLADAPIDGVDLEWVEVVVEFSGAAGCFPVWMVDGFDYYKTSTINGVPAIPFFTEEPVLDGPISARQVGIIASRMM